MHSTDAGECRQMTPTRSADIQRGAFSQPAAAFTPSGLERYKLDRLRELRAVIDVLHAERRALNTLRRAAACGRSGR
jgi:hypothetical protein